MLDHPASHPQRRLRKVNANSQEWPEYFNQFAYVPKHESLVCSVPSSYRSNSPDFELPAPISDDEEHILVLEFSDNSKLGSTSAGVKLTPTATKKLVDKRNECFIKAVNELLAASQSNDDPCLLLQAAARDHIPVNPNGNAKNTVGLKAVPSSAERPSVSTLLDEVVSSSWYAEQLAYRTTLPSKDSRFALLSPPLPENIEIALKEARSIDSFYIHQVQAIQALVNLGKHVIVSTPTASGKSVIYQVPLLLFLERDPLTRAIFVYPTKALAQDQKLAMQQLLHACPSLQHMRVDTYDGDTPTEARKDIRENANVIFTNFDMIHASILPNEDKWRPFLKRLKVQPPTSIDLRCRLSCTITPAIFGTFKTSGSRHVAYIMRRFRRVCSALGMQPIANPLSHMSQIFGLHDNEIEVVTEDGAPTASKDFIVWTPSPIEVHPKSPMQEAVTLMRVMMERGLRVILFCKIRKVCELTMKTLRTELSVHGRQDILERVQSYRGGYNPEDRRKIEREAFTGHLLGIVATNALELGVDIGSLDAVIMLGFPISLASFVSDITCLLKDEILIEEFKRQQAGRAGRRSRDSIAALVADSLLPLDKYYMENPEELFKANGDELVLDMDSAVVLEDHSPPPLCSRRNASCVLLMKNGSVQGSRKVCEANLKKDFDGWSKKSITILKVAKVRQVDVNWTTAPRKGQKIDAVDVDTPTWHLETTGLWFDVPKWVLNFLESKKILGAEAIHSAEHAFLNRFALEQDVRTECKNEDKEYMRSESSRKRPARLIFYDPRREGGVTYKAFENERGLTRRRHFLTSMQGTVLRAILNVEFDHDAIPVQFNDRHLGQVYDTIIPAAPVGSNNQTQIHVEEA
ncbi:hypothetical protein DL96DRAFT_1792453 [Flagelloscypha sp. PMI_526]|nr:hypothetical protein DL96DRAFT_1792453 [Flagelloscypha sp. PMI_526]